ncbi:hypothetical protein HHL22_20370 [Hymenobacter sp. RP-2-7]|uniref:DUF922 domain-containing protein n=1 Tax=Hymenobacter polaris TaxID=2682546 RepID=A0A7Y0AHP0_9BACT|nr:hypothetical protein [Hymenobacter polaris]NML67563.1 hypothetical protein [Hymenobacter polaris]
MFLSLLARLLLVAGLGTLGGGPPHASRAAQAEVRGMVYWQAQRPLRWGDFRARTCPVQTRAGERALGACVATGIAVLPCADARGRGTFQVASYLDPSHSWVRDSASFANRLTLAHEQVHFDINELYARQIRALVASYYRAGRYPFTAELHGRIAELLVAKTTCNNRFDAEVAADSIGGSVTRWQATVQQQLLDLAAYGAEASTCR